MIGSTAGPDSLDAFLRLFFTVGLLLWNTLEGAVFHNEYPAPFVSLYTVPLWRILLLAAVITGALWCRSVGLMLAFAAFFYSMDMEVTMDKWK